jgi:hypothetical protein
MGVITCSSTDAFVVRDFDDAPRSTGVVRSAKKVLRDGAWNLARSVTYTAAVHRQQVSGVSAGINAVDDERDAAVAAFIAEIGQTPGLSLFAGKGVSSAALGDLGADNSHDESVNVACCVAALQMVLGDLDGKVVRVEPGAALAAPLSAALEAAGASVEPLETLSATCAAVVVGSKPGALGHQAAATLDCGCVLPTTRLAVTPRALATARNAGAFVVPDFLVLAAEVETDPDVAAARVTEVLEAVRQQDGDPYLGACEIAEEFLDTWASIPFGRPMA